MGVHRKFKNSLGSTLGKKFEDYWFKLVIGWANHSIHSIFSLMVRNEKFT